MRSWGLGWKVCSCRFAQKIISEQYQRVRLFATKNMKSLGTLSHHEKMCKALAFAHKQLDLPLCDEDDEMTDEEKAARERWLVAGSEDHRITVWRLMNFDK